jgi:hypothetical protein
VSIRFHPRFLTLVAAHELGLSQDMTLHGVQYFLLGGTGLQRQLNIQRVKFEIITVRFPCWGTWSSVSNPSKIINPLFSAEGQCLRSRHIFAVEPSGQLPALAAEHAKQIAEQFVYDSVKLPASIPYVP